MQASSPNLNTSSKSAKNPFPSTTGKYETGVYDFLSAPSPYTNSVLIRFYYPTCLKNSKTSKPEGTQALWHENPDYIKTYAPTPSLGKLFNYYWKNVKINSFKQSEILISDDIEKMDVVVFSHGLVGNRFVYSMTCQEIASQGYLVAAVEHRDGSASLSFEVDEKGKFTPVEYVKHPITKAGEFDEESFILRNKQVEKRTDELKYVCETVKTLNKQGLPNFLESGFFPIRNLVNKISDAKFNLVGHSFGGGTVLNLISKSEPGL